MSDPATSLLAEIDRHGSISFARFQELALYGDGGFYELGGAGRGEDFVTSPEVGPLFGAVVGRALDQWWRELGSPEPFVVVDAGAGSGALARAVLAAGPDCSHAMRYVLVDRVEAQRARHGEHLDLEPAAEVFPVAAEDELGQPMPSGPAGPVVVSLASLPRLPFVGVILANELLDNMPTRIAERVGGEWHEVRVARAGDTQDTTFVELVIPAHDRHAGLLDRLVPVAVDGMRVPLQEAAADWLREASSVLESGVVVSIDYSRSSPELADLPMAEWLRTYRGHDHGGPPLDSPGTRDITCDVAIDQLALVRPIDRQCTQAEWLVSHGIGELVAAGRRIWRDRAGVGDLDAVRARSRVGEAEALLDESGLGAFTVCEWRT
ncbi:MAG: SAM-dependent methyltransferase [Acidimicrobiia bacterium]|nr:SAM-dependent methyltransferase [Acidimicrobiia bacterium]